MGGIVARQAIVGKCLLAAISLVTLVPPASRTDMNEDLRYPIGPFQSVRRTLTPEERAVHIAAIEAHPANMRAAVAGLSDDQLGTPYRDGGWTVRQVVHHVVDSHLMSYLRFKLAITRDHPRIMTYDEAVWAELPDASEAPVEMSLAILDALHPRWVRFLRDLSDHQFGRAIDHPEVGDITVDGLLEIYGWHCPHHEAHITRLREREGW
jgi:uncharacterized damage-inducible protein DinB